ncbi:MAG: hypothetical protein M3P06_11970 [Acidobacteriota bacterium]|nr:hypothetical protein [Acidobacteriota bacterium]
MTTRILLQTTIPYTFDDWHIGRFAMLHRTLEGAGFDVTSRDKEPGAGGVDEVLLALDRSSFDQLWLFAVDAGDGIDDRECEAITRFRQRGGGLLVTRDHQDLGSSICKIGGVGEAHFFHSRNIDPDPSRRERDDRLTANIDWPNYHSGSNGNYQRVTLVGELHAVLRRDDGSAIEWFPAHPHEGAVGVPADDATARVIATGMSLATARAFNLSVAFEKAAGDGRAIAESSFHHFCDYNWNPRAGCPSFVTEAPDREVLDDPQRLSDIRAYVTNVARWLAE